MALAGVPLLEVIPTYIDLVLANVLTEELSVWDITLSGSLIKVFREDGNGRAGHHAQLLSVEQVGLTLGEGYLLVGLRPDSNAQVVPSA